jgi:PIN domain nuclease of toxin-antitoxin system
VGSDRIVKLLLDTHVWLWALLDGKKLGAKGRKLVETATNELWLSPISVWEAALLVERGRIRVQGTFDAWVDRALTALPMQEATLTTQVAITSRRIRVDHQDPADRFLAATAEVFGLTLLTADEHLLAGRGFKHLACRG